MSDTNTTSKFRYDINALRTIAILGVLLFHYKISLLQGGFSGVDIFFVISGYLMSRIILDGLAKQTFSILNFYEKRVKRIVPALLTLLLILTVICFFIYFPNDYSLNEKNAASSIIFLSNILFWQSTGYFDPASDSNILLHTWSLSVEWQFYLIYPLILLLFTRFIRKTSSYLSIFTITTIFLFVVSLYITYRMPQASFYLLPTRAWEMMLGGVALLTERKIQNFKYRQIAAIVGYVMLLMSFIFLNNIMKWPGYYTLFPTIGTFLVIISNYNSFQLLKFAPIQFTGRISYSLYLWHWPIYVISEYIGIEKKPTTIVLFICGAFLLGYLSFKYIESIDFKAGSILTGMLTLFILTSGLALSSSNRSLFKEQSIRIANYQKSHHKEINKQFSQNGCFLSNKGNKLNDTCLVIDKSKKNILLIGDSHAAHLSEALRFELFKKNIHLSQASASGCPPVIGLKEKTRCSGVINYIYDDYIVQNANQIDGIIISANWVDWAENIPGGKKELVNSIKSTIAYLKKQNIRVVIIGQNETYLQPYANVAAKEHEFGKKISNIFLNKNSYIIDNYLSNNLSNSYIRIINSNIPNLSKNNEPYMFDLNHFTRYGANIAAIKIVKNKTAYTFFEHIQKGD